MAPDRRILRVDGPAVGGGGVGRDASGRATFVDAALPGELVEVELVEERPRYARGRLVAVIQPAPGRVVPPCPFVAAGCGGCDLQHAALDTQRTMKVQVLEDALIRVGRLPRPSLPGIEVVSLPATGHRTTVRAGVVEGRAGLRRHHSHELVVPDACLVTHPAAEELLVEGRFGDANEVTIRVGARTGERLVLVAPSASQVSVPDDVVVVGVDEVGARPAAIHEEVAGQTWRISARSFFQSRPDGADALVERVRRDLAVHHPDPIGVLVDLYAGVGLFAGSVPAERIVAVERGRSSAADARHNLGTDATVVSCDVDRWRPSAADVVVADPAREGLRSAGVAKVVATGAAAVVLVSCDAGAFGRDAGALVASGYELVAVTLVDLFPHTHHVEVVSTYVAGAPPTSP